MKNPEIFTTTSVVPEKHNILLSIDQCLPEKLPVIINNKEDMENAYQQALKFWIENFNPEKLRKELNKYLSLPRSNKAESTAQKKYFRSLRKSGIMLRSATHFYHKDSLLNDDFIYFLKQMGKLNDYYKKKSNGPKRAKKILKKISTIQDLDHNYSQASLDEYHQRIQTFINHGINYLSKDELLVPEYHALRKEFRHLMNLFKLAAVTQPNNEIIAKFSQFLINMSKELGQIHTGFVKKSIKGKIDYDNEVMTIPLELKEKLRIFYQQLQSALPQYS